jgi:hypothetical protein
MYDIFYIGTRDDNLEQLKTRFPLVKLASTFADAKHRSLTKMFWLVWNDVVPLDEFTFEYDVPAWDQQFIHVFKNGGHYDGICLASKTAQVSDRELKYRFFIKKKEVEIQASKPRLYDIFYIDTYEEYQEALQNSITEMFWMTSYSLVVSPDFKFDLYFSHSDTADREQTHSFIHRGDNGDSHNGIFLCSKLAPMSKREVEFRFPIHRREWDIVASTPTKYSKFSGFVRTYEDYKNALTSSLTELFWVIPNDVNLNPEFPFTTYFSHDNEFDRKINHVFKNGDYYDGVMLLSKHSPISEREFKYRFLTNKKDWDIEASTPKKYDIFYIDTYKEYQEACDKSSTDLFWMTSRNLATAFDFNFDLYFSHHNTYDRNQNHAFKHRVNGTDSYNGIFLCSKAAPLSKREIEYRTFLVRKEWDIVASGPVIYQQYAAN